MSVDFGRGALWQGMFGSCDLPDFLFINPMCTGIDDRLHFFIRCNSISINLKDIEMVIVFYYP
jgi:hypothetical protein